MAIGDELFANGGKMANPVSQRRSALCIPEKLTKPTRGEQVVHDLLKQLPKGYIVWYEMVLQERNLRPDFMILAPDRGVIVVEVKDWDTHAILQFGPQVFKVKMASAPVKVRNPEHKCQIYVAGAKEALSLIDELTNERFEPWFPVSYFVAFPNMTQQDFIEKGLQNAINADHVLFRTDLASIDALTARLDQTVPQLPNRIPPNICALIRRELRTDATVAIGGTTQDGMLTMPSDGRYNENVSADVFAVDSEQELIAKGIGEGPRLLRGPAGTGKTIIMLMRAKLMASNAEHTGKHLKILIVCWNISLANYMRQAFHNVGIPLQDDSDVEITHFAAWARRNIRIYLGKDKVLNPTADDYEAQLTHWLEQINPPKQRRYDAIFVDELQDFRSEWIQILYGRFMRAADPKQRDFIAAGDYAQQILSSRDRISFFKESKVTWSSLGIDMRGRSKVLRKVYRNSARLWSFAGMFYGDIGQDNEDEDGTANAGIEFAAKPGHDPELIECKGPSAQVREAVRTVKDIVADYSPRNMLILYRRKNTKSGYHLVDKLIAAFQSEGIPYEWITEDNESKATFNWAHDSVKISTVHSSKGLDAPFVIVLAAEDFYHNPDDADEEKLMYVALTRAREYIKVLHTGRNPMVDRLYAAMKMYETFNSRIMRLESNAQHAVTL